MNVTETIVIALVVIACGAFEWVKDQRDRNDAFMCIWNYWRTIGFGRWASFKAALHAWWCGNPFFEDDQ